MSENGLNTDGLSANDKSDILVVNNEKKVSIEEDKINIKLQEAVKEIIDNNPDRQEYSGEDAQREKPLTHFSSTKNLFQILRFGIQSGNFKDRAKALDPENTELDRLIPYMRTPVTSTCGYQGRDCISLNTFEASGLPTSNQLGEQLLFLVNPDIETWGLNPDERGGDNGHGTSIKNISIGDYKIGNSGAGKYEVLTVGIIKPADIRAVVIPDEESVSVLDNIREFSSKYVEHYLQERKYKGKEDTDRMKKRLLEDLWIMADVSKDEKLIKEVKTFWDEIDKIEDSQVLEKVSKLQDEVLESFVDGKEISEENLRMAISGKFGITLINAR